MAIRTSWRDLTFRIKALMGGSGESPLATPVIPPRLDRSEQFQLDFYSGGSILLGQFSVGGRFFLVSHRQGDEDTFPLSLKERKQILRKTLEERLKRMSRLNKVPLYV